MIRYAVVIVMMVVLVCSMSLAITIDGDFGDWAGVTMKVEDAQDMADSSGDVKMIQAAYGDDNLYLRMVVYGVIAPSVAETPAGMTNRYYYHWILDTDDKVGTGFENSAYEGNPTDVTPIGVDVIAMVGWRDGNPGGIEVYEALTEAMLMEDFEYAISGDSMEAMIPMGVLDVSEGDTIGISAFQEGASNDWQVDWLEPMTFSFIPMAVKPEGKLASTWANLKVR